MIQHENFSDIKECLTSIGALCQEFNKFIENVEDDYVNFKKLTLTNRKNYMNLYDKYVNLKKLLRTNCQNYSDLDDELSDDEPSDDELLGAPLTDLRKSTIIDPCSQISDSCVTIPILE